MHFITLHPNSLKIGTQVQNFVLNNPMTGIFDIFIYTGLTLHFVDFHAEKIKTFRVISCCRAMKTDINKMDHRITYHATINVYSKLEAIPMKNVEMHTT